MLLLCSGTDQCPVRVYREFARHRPLDVCEPESRFYLQPVKNPRTSVWYTRQPLGKNTIGSIAKVMAQKAGLAATNKTNHSGRKTAVQTLLHAGIPPTDVMQLTGHKNVQSLNSYSHLSLDQQRSVSNILSGQLPVLPGKSVRPPAASLSVAPNPPLSTAMDANFSLDTSLDSDIINQLMDNDGFSDMLATESIPDACNIAPISNASVGFHPSTNLSIPGYSSLAPLTSSSIGVVPLTNLSIPGTSGVELLPSTNPSTSANPYIHGSFNVVNLPSRPAQQSALSLCPTQRQSSSQQQNYKFLNGTVNGDITINFHEHISYNKPPKRRRILIDSDSEE